VQLAKKPSLISKTKKSLYKLTPMHNFRENFCLQFVFLRVYEWRVFYLTWSDLWVENFEINFEIY